MNLWKSTAKASKLKVNPHMTGGVVTFADGHAKWYTDKASIYQPFQSSQNKFWNGQLG
jgi:prepilin-type processing-associated H-X9-DG protein